MAGLETYDINTPAGSTTLAQGDNKIRELAQKACVSVDEEHNLNGKHNFPHGTLGQRPAAGNVGRIYFVEDLVSGIVCVQYDNGSSWVTVVAVGSSGLTVDGVNTSLDTHKSATIIDHPSGSIVEVKLATASVTNTKIANGALKKVHLDAANVDPQGLIASLVDGSELSSSWHTHPAGAGSSGTTFPATAQIVATGSGDVGWTNLDLTPEGVPDTAVGVILQGYGIAAIDIALDSVDKTPFIACRKDSDSDNLFLCGGRIKHKGPAFTGIEILGQRGVNVIPLDTGAKIQYKVESYSESWTIKLVGYIE